MSILISGTPVITFCNIQGGYEGEGNIDSDPLFVSNTDFHLQETLPCIDKGNNNAPDLPDNDFEGNSRTIDGDRDGTPTVDIGEFEYKPTVIADGDVAPLGNRDGTVNVGDALIALRFALSLEIPTQEDVDHGDVAPLDIQTTSQIQTDKFQLAMPW
ncbi:MAG: choice-of-anchor Q domain-containing protein [Thermodesulfobacteriota bacterium]|nr:choice-of-anchor Q domain-containing protein [Thermodesulfobacteriota bacterium]